MCYELTLFLTVLDSKVVPVLILRWPITFNSLKMNVCVCVCVCVCACACVYVFVLYVYYWFSLFFFKGCSVIVGHYGIYPCAAPLQVFTGL